MRALSARSRAGRGNVESRWCTCASGSKEGESSGESDMGVLGGAVLDSELLSFVVVVVVVVLLAVDFRL